MGISYIIIRTVKETESFLKYEVTGCLIETEKSFVSFPA